MLRSDCVQEKPLSSTGQSRRRCQRTAKRSQNARQIPLTLIQSTQSEGQRQSTRQEKWVER